MTNDEICDAIANKQAVCIKDWGREWLILPRLFGLDPDGNLRLAYQLLDFDKVLPQYSPEAGDEWRHTSLRPYACGKEAMTRARLILDAHTIDPYAAIPLHMQSGIAKVLGAG
jgi:hypothetical protein